jgi:7,8-dihydropterin-6-yl-methyl-4-(beta-D-ribofuranosyl)aminobenzene 5'-phosphate synthase
MQLTVLADNNTLIDRYFLAEPALSIFIQDESTRILFDCGYSDVFIRNAARAGIDLLDLDVLALSHGHLDHTWGLTELIRLFTQAGLNGRAHQKPRVIAHPGTFAGTLDETAGEIGSMLSRDRLECHFQVSTSTAPVSLTERLTWLGEIPRTTGFEAREPIGVRRDDGRPDFIPEDTALAYRSEDGLVVVTGCSHAGIGNIVERARAVTGVHRVVDIIGGLHLQEPTAAQLSGTRDYLGSLGLKGLHACHCTDLASKIALAESLPLREVGAGMTLTYS